MRVNNTNKILCQLSAILLVFVLLVSLQTFKVSAAASGSHTPITGVSVGVSGATDNSMSGGVVTVTAKGSGGLGGIGARAKTATITITNSGDTKVQLSFDWVATKVQKLVIDDKETTGASSTFTKMLSPGESFKITITTGKNSTVNKLELKNFGVTVPQENISVTIQFDDTKGSVNADGNAVQSNGSVTVSGGQLAAAATPASGCTFLGWVRTDTNGLLTKDTSATLGVTESLTIEAVFVNAKNDTAWFYVDQKFLVNSLAVAITKGTTVMLANNGTLPADNYSIPSGVTLLIPFDELGTLCTTKPASDITITTSLLGDNLSANKWGSPTAFRTLTISDGTTISVEGAISISGKMSSAQTSNGCPTKSVGMIHMNGNSSITIEEKAFLYAWGYITGEGYVTVKSGGTVYENFQIKDWRGGTVASRMLSNKQKVFPVSQYYVQNVEVPMMLETGALEFGYTAIVVSVPVLGDIYGEATIPFIGGEGMFRNEGTITKDYLESTDRS